VNAFAVEWARHYPSIARELRGISDPCADGSLRAVAADTDVILDDYESIPI
jgi:hypothetical protein